MKTVPARSLGLAVLLAGAVVHAAGGEAGGSWTNVAGHALKGVPVSIQGQTVTFKLDGSVATRDVPLAAFPREEQNRLRVAVQDAAVPEGLQSACEFAARILKRARLLHANGQTSDAEYRTTVDSALAALRQQAVPLVERNELSAERLELILNKLATKTE